MKSTKIKYMQRFRSEWLEFFEPWLTRCDDDWNKPYCRFCKCRLDCNRTLLARHQATNKHAKAVTKYENEKNGIQDPANMLKPARKYSKKYIEYPPSESAVRQGGSKYYTTSSKIKELPSETDHQNVEYLEE